MIKANVVIDLMFGDSGKGLTADFLCAQQANGDPIVVRFSGGQQAGHNVVIDGVSHVHSSFGSGTLRGVPSYFTEHCTVSPINMMLEHEVLMEKGIIPDLYVHPLAMITTPADIAYNRVIEKRLGHGSCGLGVGATMDRNLNTGYKLYAVDLLHPEFLKAKLKQIYAYYHQKLMGDGEFTKIYYQQKEYFDEAMEKLPLSIKLYSYLKKYDHLIFEGSQGVLLDMDHGIFPNVTYGNTTSKNALKICAELGILDIELYYVTRCYQTRHGSGWMSNQNEIELINTEHEINVFNQWQKEFKIGEIDYDLLNHALRIDNIYSESVTRKNLVVTCLDQRPDFNFDYAKLNANFEWLYESYSPDSSALQRVMNKKYSGMFSL